jgi:hypothetical protein
LHGDGRAGYTAGRRGSQRMQLTLRMIE